MLPLDRYESRIAADAVRVAAAAQEADHDLPVPTCPGWTVSDLTRHLGGVHRWAIQILRTGSAPSTRDPGPDDADDLPGWLADGATQLLSTLRSTDPQSSVWTFGRDPHRARFWWRRQAHETSMHLWDLLAAAGGAPEVEPDFAADGVLEVAEVFLPRQVELGRREPLAAPVDCVLTDTGTSVRLTSRPADHSGAVATTLRGPAHAVLLALWGRTGTTGLEVDGDAATLAAALRTITP
ncbi:MAG: maleylpyruvate isomerase family mycothiol-dependent enzyme [Candidatus Nanopelagicales bacterium]